MNLAGPGPTEEALPTARRCRPAPDPPTTSLPYALRVAALDASEIELLDLGGGARLERFGERIVDRPHPAALGSRQATEVWRDADLRFDRERGWTGPAADDGGWHVRTHGLTLELRPTDAGQVGLFPEHAAMLPWLDERITRRASGDQYPEVLHLFAYTGLATLAMAAAGAAVAHVDASRPTVAWARRDAELSGLTDRPVRWIVDDAVAFTVREGRRGRRYAGIVLDPPSYGHGPGAGRWRLEEDLPALLDACGAVLEPDGFVLLTAHTPAYGPDRLAGLLATTLGRTPAAVEAADLVLSTQDGRHLDLGAFARSPGGA